MKINDLELYNARKEAAISETADKYGRYCHYIAYGDSFRFKEDKRKRKE